MHTVLPYRIGLNLFSAGMILCSSSEVKNLSFLHLMALRYRRYFTYGIRATVETLGPNWAQNAPTCFILELHVYSPWSCAREAGTLAQNYNNPIPCQLNVSPEHVSTQVSVILLLTYEYVYK